MLRDCMTRAEDLPPDARTLVRNAVAEIFTPTTQMTTGSPASASTTPSGGLGTLASRSRIEADVLIVTVKPVEYDAALIAFELEGNSFVEREDRRYHEFELRTARTDRPIQVVLSSIGEAGNFKAITVVGEMLRHYQVQTCLLVGIAAGRLSALSQGDFALPDRVYWLEPGVSYASGKLPAPDHADLNRRMNLLTKYYRVGDPFRALLRNRLAVLESNQFPPGIDSSHRPKFVDSAIVACSEKLLRDNSLEELAGARGLNRNIKLADMESYGFAQALAGIDWAIVRAVSDYGDEKKNDDWQMVASVTASVAARNFMETTYAPGAEDQL
jgi:nucleoside phosphorylase